MLSARELALQPIAAPFKGVEIQADQAAGVGKFRACQPAVLDQCHFHAGHRRSQLIHQPQCQRSRATHVNLAGGIDKFQGRRHEDGNGRLHRCAPKKPSSLKGNFQRLVPGGPGFDGCLKEPGRARLGRSRVCRAAQVDGEQSVRQGPIVDVGELAPDLQWGEGRCCLTGSGRDDPQTCR